MALSETSYFTYATPHGPATIYTTNKGVAAVTFEEQGANATCRPTTMGNEAATQLQEYLAGKRRTFDVPLDMQGSAFQKAVWTEICSIPYGEQRTAADIARAMGKTGAHRSVGTAVRLNRLAPFVPTQRVANQSATGRQAKILRGLFALEQRNSQQ